ncbi:MAG TPA: hypothetical protein VD840_16030 [Sinorhizobium sp.]|nr:hypothetical protein [Sinorhizobium sp.]
MPISAYDPRGRLRRHPDRRAARAAPDEALREHLSPEELREFRASGVQSVTVLGSKSAA